MRLGTVSLPEFVVWFCQVGMHPREGSTVKSSERRGLEECLSGLSQELNILVRGAALVPDTILFNNHTDFFITELAAK